MSYNRRLSFWRRWSPWYLRRQLASLGHSLADGCRIGSTDRENTATERNYRLVAAALDGHDDPVWWCQRYSVKGATLCIDATRDEPNVQQSAVHAGEAETT